MRLGHYRDEIGKIKLFIIFIRLVLERFEATERA